MPEKQEIGFKIRNTDYQILTNDDEVCIPSPPGILLAVLCNSRKQLCVAAGSNKVTFEI